MGVSQIGTGNWPKVILPATALLLYNASLNAWVLLLMERSENHVKNPPHKD